MLYTFREGTSFLEALLVKCVEMYETLFVLGGGGHLARGIELTSHLEEFGWRRERSRRDKVVGAEG